MQKPAIPYGPHMWKSLAAKSLVAEEEEAAK